MAPHEAQLYKIRSSTERANSRLKEDFGANNVMVQRAREGNPAFDVWGHHPVCGSTSSHPRIGCQRAKRIICTQRCKLFILQKAQGLFVFVTVADLRGLLQGNHAAVHHLIEAGYD